jgi:IPT/TIG domain
VVSGSNSFSDTSGPRIANIAQPLPLYPSIAGMQATPPPLYRPLLNASGSLYYIAYSNYFEIVDVLHAKLLMRFSLNETIQATASPLAIDAGGRHVYLATDKGLTIVDLGAAPLAVGHLSQESAGAGSQVTVRGSGFDSSITTTVGGEPASVNVTDENTLTLTVPAAGGGPEDILLTRGDGRLIRWRTGLLFRELRAVCRPRSSAFQLN